MLQNIFLVGSGGFLGAISRFGVALIITKYYSTPFPLSTLVINLLGSFLITLFLGIFSSANHQSLILFFATGFLGAFTTFSTFSFETVELFKRDQVLLGLAYVFLSVGLCLLGAYFGYVVAKQLR